MAFVGTNTPLTGAATWTSRVKNTDRYDRIAGTVFADQAGTLHVEQSSDGTNWDVDTSYSISASDGKGFSEELVAAFWRLRYVNGATPQTAFRLYGRATAAGDS